MQGRILRGVPRDPDFFEGPDDQLKKIFVSWRLLFVVPRSYKGPGIPCSLYISGPARKAKQSYHYLD